jgi:hypothetical protein
LKWCNKLKYFFGSFSIHKPTPKQLTVFNEKHTKTHQIPKTTKNNQKTKKKKQNAVLLRQHQGRQEVHQGRLRPNGE